MGLNFSNAPNRPLGLQSNAPPEAQSQSQWPLASQVVVMPTIRLSWLVAAQLQLQLERVRVPLSMPAAHHVAQWRWRWRSPHPSQMPAPAIWIPAVCQPLSAMILSHFP
jgi:hypothetical protein